MTPETSSFQDLKDPLLYKKTHGFRTGPFSPDTVRAYGQVVYFYQGGLETSCTTPECRVLSSRINQHESAGDHTLTLLLNEDWVSDTLTQLKDAMRLVYTDKSCLPLSTAAAPDFDTFWDACRKPFQKHVLTLEEPSRRRRTKTFVNMFDGMRELTGTCQLTRGGSVCVSVRFTVSEGEQASDGFGIRAQFGSGIRVIRMGGIVPKITAPWDWSRVQFSDLTLPLRGPFHVKTPALVVTSVDGLAMTLDVNRHEEFKSALDDFHHLAGVATGDQWTVEHTGRIKPQPGSIVMGTVEPNRNNGDITWHSRKVFVRPPRAEQVVVQKTAAAVSEEGEDVTVGGVRKRDSDTSDNSSDAQTKRRYN